jgi:hypothetical protein
MIGFGFIQTRLRIILGLFLKGSLQSRAGQAVRFRLFSRCTCAIAGKSTGSFDCG